MAEGSFSSLAASGDLTGNWSWTVWLLIPVVLLLAYVTARCVGPLGDPPRAHAVVRREPLPRRPSRGRTPHEPHTIQREAASAAGDPTARCRSPSLAAACGQKSGVAGSMTAAAAARRATTTGVDSPPITAAPVGTHHRARRPDDRRRRRRRTPGATTSPARRRPRPPPTTAPPRRGPYEPGGRRHRRRHRRRDRHRHPRPGHRRVADPADELRRRQGHLLEVPRRERARRRCSVARCGSCSATTSSTRRPRVQVCREMVEDEGAFLLVGGGGADQITACAKYANENGIPYFSAGVNEDGPHRPRHVLRDVAHLRRAGAVADRSSCRTRSITEIGLVVSDTPSFDDAPRRDQGGRRGGRPRRSPYETRINKTAAEAEPLSEVQELKNSGAEAVFLLSSPLVFIGLANQGLQPELHADLARARASRAASTRSRTSAARRSAPASSSRRPPARRDRPARPRLPPGVRAVRRRRDRRRHRPRSCGRSTRRSALMFEATGPELGRAAFMNTLETDDGVRQRHLPAGAVHARRPLRRHRRPPARGRLRDRSSTRRPSSSSSAG